MASDVAKGKQLLVGEVKNKLEEHLGRQKRAERVRMITADSNPELFRLIGEGPSADDDSGWWTRIQSLSKRLDDHPQRRDDTRVESSYVSLAKDGTWSDPWAVGREQAFFSVYEAVNIDSLEYHRSLNWASGASGDALVAAAFGAGETVADLPACDLVARGLRQGS
jgi:hypothetical protein